MNIEDIMLREASHKKTNTAWIHLHEISKIIKFIETESRMVGGREKWKDLFNAYSISDLQDENFCRLIALQGECT